jgi:hypothetical protein
MTIYNLYAILRKPISPVAPAAFLYIRKEVFDQLEGFNEQIQFAEDFDLTTRIRKAGYKFAYIIIPLFKFSVRRLDKMGRPKFFGQMIWDGIIMLFPESLSKRLVIGYEAGDTSQQ